jgi:hypothetical protein
MSELGNSLPPPARYDDQPCYYEVDERTALTSRDQHPTITHHLSHKLSPIAPPTRHRSDIPAEMALAFVLDVEREDVLGQVFPHWCTLDQSISML